MTTTLLGPVLYSADCSDTRWVFHVGLLVAGNDPAPPIDLELSLEDAEVEGPVMAADFRDLDRGIYWRFRVSIERGATERKFHYRLTAADGTALTEWLRDVRVPALGALPRIGFFSCNGFSDAKLARNEKEPAKLWTDLIDLHDGNRRTSQDPAAGLHLLIGGGDQLYCDEIWHSSHVLNRWAEASHREMRDAGVLSAAEQRELEREFVDLYVRRFSQRPFANALARIAGVFTWDDHDIFDGYGSYPADLQGCSLFACVFKAAARAFDAFQMGGLAPLGPLDHPEQHRLQTRSFAAGSRILDVMLPDLRSSRTLERVMGRKQHDDLEFWLSQREKELKELLDKRELERHVLFVSTIPVVYMRFQSLMERATGWLAPLSAARLDDDLRDQWESEFHRGERAEIVALLLGHARATHSRVTILSGDVHVASRGRVVSQDPQHRIDGEPFAFIEQLTASAIVHPPPGAAAFQGIRAFGREASSEISQISSFVRSELLQVGNEAYVRARNWLALAFDGPPNPGAPTRPARLWAQWRTDREPGPLSEQVVVEPPPWR